MKNLIILVLILSVGLFLGYKPNQRSGAMQKGPEPNEGRWNQRPHEKEPGQPSLFPASSIFIFRKHISSGPHMRLIPGQAYRDWGVKRLKTII